MRLPAAAALGLPLGFLALFFGWPLAAILERSLRDGVPWGVLTARSTGEVVWFTVWQATASTALTLLAGLPAAWALARFDFPGRRLASALVVIPFVMPTIVVASAFVAILPESLDRSVWGILLAHVFFNVAVVIRVVGGFWGSLDERLWEAAATLGAGPWARFRHVTLPALTPPLASASAIVFLFSFTSFGIVLVLGGPAYRTLEAAIYDEAVRFFDLRTAATLALVQLVAVTAVLAVVGKLERRSGAITLTAPVTRMHGRAPVAAVSAVVVTLSLLALPLAVLVERAFRGPGGHGFDHFRALAQETPALLVEPWRSALNSLLFASVATALALVVGGLAAASVVRRGSWLDAIVMLPLGASAAMLGFGFLVAFDDAPLDWRGSGWLVPAAQALVAAPFVVRVLAPSLRAIDARLREAAAVLGASPARVWREVDVPLVVRAVTVAAGFAFAVSLGEFGATVFVARSDMPTLPVAIFRFLGRPGAENAGLAMALCVVLMGLTAGAMLATEWLAAGRRR